MKSKQELLKMLFATLAELQSKTAKPELEKRLKHRHKSNILKGNRRI